MPIGGHHCSSIPDAFYPVPVGQGIVLYLHIGKQRSEGLTVIAGKICTGSQAQSEATIQQPVIGIYCRVIAPNIF